MLAPGVDQLLADTVLFGDLHHRTLVCLALNLHHLAFAEPTLLHDFLPLQPSSQEPAGPQNGRHVTGTRNFLKSTRAR
jgi:hypothetical protein